MSFLANKVQHYCKPTIISITLLNHLRRMSLPDLIELIGTRRVYSPLTPEVLGCYDGIHLLSKEPRFLGRLAMSLPTPNINLNTVALPEYPGACVLGRDFKTTLVRATIASSQSTVSIECFGQHMFRSGTPR